MIDYIRRCSKFMIFTPITDAVHYAVGWGNCYRIVFLNRYNIEVYVNENYKGSYIISSLEKVNDKIVYLPTMQDVYPLKYVDLIEYVKHLNQIRSSVDHSSNLDYVHSVKNILNGNVTNVPTNKSICQTLINLSFNKHSDKFVNSTSGYCFNNTEMTRFIDNDFKLVGSEPANSVHWKNVLVNYVQHIVENDFSNNVDCYMLRINDIIKDFIALNNIR